LAHSCLILDPTPGVPSAQLQLALARIHFIEARPAETVRHAEAVLEQLTLPTETHGAAEAALLMGLIAQNDLQCARISAEALLAGTDGPDSQLALAAAVITLGCLAWNEGRAGPALGLVRAGVKRADRFAWEGFRLHPRLELADMLVAIGEFNDAEIVLTECHEEIELSEDALYRAGPVIGRASLHLAAGRPAEAVVDAEAGLSLVQRLGTWLFLPRARRILASITLSRGDLSGALALLGTTVEDTRFASNAVAGGGPLVGGRLLELRQGPGRCVEALASVYDDLPSHKPLLIEEPAAAAWLVRTALAAGDRPRAEAVVACSAQLAADNPTFPSVVAGAAHCRGVLDRDVAALELAGAGHRHPWARASAIEDAGTVLAEHGDGAEARERFEKALDSYDQIGFERDTARVRARLRRLGIRHRHWSHVVRPSWGWESLTDTEVRVSDLVAEGLTNPQVAARMFLSRHTVDFHLRQIFRKLAIGSRVDLTRLALEAKSRTQSPP
jgi:DNA-binding CsgD family transcriptional regulator/tetratricopeptide (TPR) repeat protein